MMINSPDKLTEHFFRHNYAKMVAILVHYFGLKEVEIAEDIMQDTLIEAMEKWSFGSLPENPEGWMMDVAKKKVINLLRRQQIYQKKVLPNLTTNSVFEMENVSQSESTLKMIFACCNPDLSPDAQISLALKTLCGLSVGEIADALLTSEATINKRLYRAKQKFRDGSIVFQIPADLNLTDRLDSVLSTLYLLFNEGYYSTHHKKTIRVDLCFEAIRLLKEVIAFYPDLARAKALLALMYLSVARFESRIDEKGVLILLSDQDRSRWDKELIAKGIDYLQQSTKSEELSVYHLQAGIAAEHCLAGDFLSTNWQSIYRQYLILEKMNKNVMVTFNRIIAKFFGINAPEALIDLLALENESELQKNVHYYAAIGVFYKKLGRKDKGLPYFSKALTLANSAEQTQIERRMHD